MNYSELSEILMGGADSGFTIGADGELAHLESGYIVSGPEPLMIRSSPPNALWLHIVIDEWRQQYPGKLIGAWVSDDGLIYFDANSHIDNLEDALHLGRVNKQLAIWDCANGKSIPVCK